MCKKLPILKLRLGADQHAGQRTRVKLQSTKALTFNAAPVDTEHASDKEGAGFGDLNDTRRTNRAMRFFHVCSLPALSMGGGSGEAFGLAGYLVRRFANPAICRSPRLATGSGSTVQGHAQ
jgi:hypothetical protein